MLSCLLQGCSLGLDVSVLRRSRDAFSQHLGLVSVSVKCGNVSVSSRTESQTSRSRLGLVPQGLVYKWQFSHRKQTKLYCCTQILINNRRHSIFIFCFKYLKVAFKPLTIWTTAAYPVVVLQRVSIACYAEGCTRSTISVSVFLSVRTDLHTFVCHFSDIFRCVAVCNIKPMKALFCFPMTQKQMTLNTVCGNVM